jgi:hypothetical protein
MIVVNGGNLYKIKCLDGQSCGNHEEIPYLKIHSHFSFSRSEHELAASQGYCATLISSW